MDPTLKYSYGGVSMQELSDRFDDVFEETYDEELYATKKTYCHSEPGLSFKYKYVFQETHFMEDDDDDGELLTSLSLVILPESFCKAKRAELLDNSGIEPENESKLDVADVFRMGWAGVVQFAAECFKGKDRLKNLETIKDTVASCVGAFDGLRGFYIDRRVNMLGTTGWDIIYEAKGKIKDALKYSMRRLEKEYKETSNGE